MCQRTVGSQTSTLASQGRSNTEKIEEDLAQLNSEEAAIGEIVGSHPQNLSQHPELLPPTPFPRVTLPPYPPVSPITTHFPFPPSDCLLSDGYRAPGSARASVLRCPSTQGFPCSPSIVTSPSLVSSTPNRSLYSTGTTPQTLAWDHYRDSPTFSLPAGWSVPADNPLWRGLPVRQSIASSTDPFLLEGSVSDIDTIDGIEKLRSDTEEIRKVQLVSTDCSELSDFPLNRGRLESAADSQHSFLELVVSDIGADTTASTMDQVKATQLLKAKQRLQDEMDDLSPESITSEIALDMKEEVKRIWEMKNDFRDGVRDLVASLPSGSPEKTQWEQSCKEMVDKVISFRIKVLAAIERVRPVEQLTEFQKKSLELQERAIEDSRAVRKEQEEWAKKEN